MSANSSNQLSQHRSISKEVTIIYHNYKPQPMARGPLDPKYVDKTKIVLICDAAGKIIKQSQKPTRPALFQLTQLELLVDQHPIRPMLTRLELLVDPLGTKPT